MQPRHSHIIAQKIPNSFLPQCITVNYTLVCTIANTALHIIYKCVREYMVSDYRWLTLICMCTEFHPNNVLQLAHN